MKKITVIVPCYNEERGVGSVIDGIPRQQLRAHGYKVDVLVVNNNSTDKTVKVAESKGVRVVDELRQGKGYAIATGFQSISDDTDIVVMLDGDNSYQAKEMLRLIEPLDSGFCDVIVGTRLSGKITKDSMSYFNRVGNWLFTFLVRVAYSGNVTDVCTGYFAWKKYVVDDLAKSIESNGFSIEMDMVTKMAKSGYQIYSVPITYTDREGSSSLRPIKDGSMILYTWLRNIFWKPVKAPGRAYNIKREVVRNG